MTSRRVPLVTLLLIAANIFAAFALLIYPDFAFEFGFRSDHPRLWAAVTSLFLHANLFHLLGNMVFLAAVGVAVEMATGSLRFAIVYFASGLTGVAVHFLANRHSPGGSPLIGASGCIAGCAAYYSVRYTRMRVPLAPKFALSVAAVTIIWLILQIAGAFIRIGDGNTASTSYWAHLGGFAAGVLLSFLFRAPDFGQIKLGHEVLDRMNDRGPAAVVTAAEEFLTRNPKDTKVLWDLAMAQHQQGEVDAETEVLLRLLETVPEEDISKVLARLTQIDRISRLSVIKRLQFADKFGADVPGVARLLLRSVVDGPDSEPQRPDALLTLAAIEKTPNPKISASLLEELADKYPLHPAAELARKRGWIT